MSGLWILPLAATLLACAALARLRKAVAHETRLVRESAARLAPLASSLHDTTERARRYGVTVADAARRYTPGDGQRRRR